MSVNSATCLLIVIRIPQSNQTELQFERRHMNWCRIFNIQSWTQCRFTIRLLDFMTASLNLHPFYNQKQKRWTRLVMRKWAAVGLEKVGQLTVSQASVNKLLPFHSSVSCVSTVCPPKKKKTRASETTVILTVETMVLKKGPFIWIKLNFNFHSRTHQKNKFYF